MATLNSAGIVYSDGTVTYSANAGGVGSYAMMYCLNGAETRYGPGTGLAGSWLYYSYASGWSGNGNGAGSWRVMGTVYGGNQGTSTGVSIFCRYA